LAEAISHAATRAVKLGPPCRAVEANDPQSQQVLADRLHIPPSWMVAIELESARADRAPPDPFDRRTLYVTTGGQRGSPGTPHDERADVRQYFGPALRVDVGSIALASLGLLNSERRSGESTLAHTIGAVLLRIPVMLWWPPAAASLSRGDIDLSLSRAIEFAEEDRLEIAEG
jgi:hypothetical protein